MCYKPNAFTGPTDQLIQITNDLISIEKSNSEKEKMMDSVFMSASLLSFYFKSHHYRDENEYRLLIPISGRSSDSDIKYRTRGSSLVPYTEFNWKSATPCPLKRVWIGPAAAHDTTPESVKAFLKHHGYGDEIEVRKSKIPYRSL